jgi:hypothetical protein
MTMSPTDSLAHVTREYTHMLEHLIALTPEAQSLGLMKEVDDVIAAVEMLHLAANRAVEVGVH